MARIEKAAHRWERETNPGKAEEGSLAQMDVENVDFASMSSPAIKNVTAEGTSVLVTFPPNSTVRELAEEDYYYTVTVTDMVTNRVVIDEADSSDAEAGGEEFRNEKASGTKDVTTKKRLLASEGDIDISYVSLPELKLHPDADTAERIWKEDTEKHIYLKNNETYVFIAEVSELACVLETDKLKWSISSGDTKAASIKPTSSTFEAQLSTVRTGTFTVTATSTATKQAVVTFTVTVDPFQSGEDADNFRRDAVPIAWIGDGQRVSLPEERKRTA